MPEIRDLAVAEQCYRRSFELYSEEDRMGRARCLGQLGSVALKRFLEARQASRPAEEGLQHLSQAAHYYQQALDMTPANALPERATAHNQLGNIYADTGQIEAALRHYRESIRYKEAMQDRFGAGGTRCNAARILARKGRFADAHDWARSALRDYESCENADERIVDTLKLLEVIESALQATSRQ